MAMDMSVALKINAGVTGQQAVDQLRTSMDKLNGAAESVGQGFGMAKAAIGAFIGLQAAQGVMNFARETINAADSINDMSERTGLAVDTLSELDFAAKMNGRTLDDVQTALTRVSVKATDAATGNKAAAIAFDALGVSVRNADGSMRTSLAITEDIGAAFNEIRDPTLKAALAVEIFGKQGPALIPLIQNMQESRKEARELGGVVGPEFAAQAALFNDNLDRMNFMLKGMAASILSEVLPAMDRMFTEYRTGIKVFGSFGSALWNIGTTNPFKTPSEQAYEYGKQVSDLEAAIKRLDAAGTVYDRRNADRLRGELESVKKMAEYFREIAGIKDAGAGRGFINPPLVRGPEPDTKRIMAQLTAANTSASAAPQLSDAERERLRQEKERAQILQTINDEITRMVQGEEALTIAKLRSLGASDAEIAQAEAVIRQRSQIRAVTESDKEVSRLAKERQGVLQSLNDEITKMVSGEDALTLAKLRSLGASEAEIAQAEAAMRQRTQLRAMDREMDEQIRATEEQKRKAIRTSEELAEAGKRVYEETRTPLERLNNEMSRLSGLLDQGAIDWDTYSRAIFKAQEDFDDLGKKSKDTMSDLQSAIEGWGRQATDTFVDFAFTGKATFKDLVTSILQDIARMLIQKQVMAPLMSAVGGYFGFANGGVMTNSGPVPLNTYANGGIANSPQVALFGEGRMPEAYVPLPDGRTIPVTMQGQPGTGGTNNVVVNVNVESGQAEVDGDKGAELGRLVAGVVKAELINQKRPGGLLAA